MPGAGHVPAAAAVGHRGDDRPHAGVSWDLPQRAAERRDHRGPVRPRAERRGSRPPTNVREPLVAIVNAGASGPAANASGLEAISAAAAAEADHANAITTTHTSANAVLSDAQTLITEMISDGLESCAGHAERVAHQRPGS